VEATHLGLPRPPDPAPFRNGAGTPHLTTLGMKPGGIHGPLREGHTAKALDQGGLPMLPGKNWDLCKGTVGMFRNVGMCGLFLFIKLMPF
jgi:hypothetical protein